MGKKIFLSFFLFLLYSASWSNQWLTWYEKHDYNQTPDYPETISFSKKLAQASSLLHYTTFGKSHQLRDLPLLIFDADGYFTPDKVKASGKVVLLIQACIHPGEPNGKDAGLMFLRDIVINGQYQEFLENITILFIPVLNADGHERFGPYNRINQQGPLEMGWRTNSLNLNLNRDFLKADSREIQHFIQLWDKWQPDFFIDTHSTNGGDYQYPMTYILETFGNMDSELTHWCQQVFIPSWQEAMQEDGYPVFPYVSYRRWHDPRSGLVSGPSPPALSNGYAAVRNRPGLLLETHMLKPYKVRVQSTYLTFAHTVELLDKQHKNLKHIINQADKNTADPQFRSKPFALNYNTTSDSVIVDFLGVEYHDKESRLSGGRWFIYNSDKPVTYQIPLFNKQEVSSSVMLPEAYVVPVQYDDIIKRLLLHGVEISFLENETEIDVETYRFYNVKLSSWVNEGRQTADFELESIREKRNFPRGSAIISMNQPLARLIAHALEPQAPSSFAFWGDFNSIFQRTEYFESYVMEKMARQMMEQNPELEKLFEQKKSSDKQFASDPRAILNWFYEQTPYVDQQHNIYPIGRIVSN